jgi:hypothetical protein
LFVGYLYDLPFAGLRSVWKYFSDQATEDLSALHQLSDIFSSVTTANQEERLVLVSTPPVPPDCSASERDPSRTRSQGGSGTIIHDFGADEVAEDAYVGYWPPVTES